MFIGWHHSYELGIPSVDSDHRKLVAIVNQFFGRSASGATTEELRSILRDLLMETMGHFAREEALLERADVPQLPSHIAEHQKLVQQLRHFSDSYGGTAPGLTAEAADFLSHWLIDHINYDRPCKPYLRRLT